MEACRAAQALMEQQQQLVVELAQQLLSDGCNNDQLTEHLRAAQWQLATLADSRDQHLFALIFGRSKDQGNLDEKDLARVANSCKQFRDAIAATPAESVPTLAPQPAPLPALVGSWSFKTHDRLLLDFNGEQFWARVTSIGDSGKLNVVYEIDGFTEDGVELSRVVERDYATADDTGVAAAQPNCGFPQDAYNLPIGVPKPGRYSYNPTVPKKGFGADTQREYNDAFDEALRRAVAEGGLDPGVPGFDWKLVGANRHVRDYQKTTKQLHERWINYARPGLKRGPWTDHEHAQLFQLAHIHDRQWMKIAAALGGRSPNDCKNRYHSNKSRAGVFMAETRKSHPQKRTKLL